MKAEPCEGINALWEETERWPLALLCEDKMAQSTWAHSDLRAASASGAVRNVCHLSTPPSLSCSDVAT